MARKSGSARGVTVVDRPRMNKRNDFYVSNRPPLIRSPLVKLPIGAIRPRGWLCRQVQLQADGFFGHLAEISGFLKKEGNAWLDPHGRGHSHWEEVPYWLKGFGDLGYVLGDGRMIRQARVWIEAAIAGQRASGYFGTQGNAEDGGGAAEVDLWPNMIMLNVLQSYYEYSGDDRVLELMTRYFRWQLGIPAKDFLPPFWQQQRAADNLASVYWLYNRTGQKWLLDLATKIHRNTAHWLQGIASWHNVNICQAFRGPQIYYQQSKDPKHKAAAERNYRTVMQEYGQVPGGLFGGDENCRPGYCGPRQGIETCGMVEMMLSCEMLLQIDAGVKWADRCEDVAFNSLAAATTADFKALRYLTAPNQVLSDAADKSPGVQNGGPMFLMNPHIHRCCQHNMGHGWPYFAEHLWMATPDNGLAAVLYSGGEVTAKVGPGAKVRVLERTRYPFDGRIAFRVRTPKGVRFPLYLRVPGWAQEVRLEINGRRAPVRARPGAFLRIERRWADGDRVDLDLPMKIKLRTWQKNKNCVSVDRGPLTYSLKIGEKHVPVDGLRYAWGQRQADAPARAKRWKAWEIHPTTPWNYGLLVDKRDPSASFSVAKKSWAKDDCPWRTAAPIELKAKARRIPQWRVDEKGLVGEVPESPVRSQGPIEEVTLIPMGCARLRVSAFPTIGR